MLRISSRPTGPWNGWKPLTSPLGQIGDGDAIVVAVAIEHDVLAVHAADECWDAFGCTGASGLSRVVLRG